MPLRATDNPLVLPLLGLLVEQPRHQYALLAGLRERYRHLRVRTSSVYTLVGSLHEAGWIEPAGGTPVVYQLTRDGVAEFRSRVVHDLEDTDPANAGRFVTALAYIGILDRATAIATVDKRLLALRQRAEDLENAVKSAGGAPVHMIEVAFFASQTRHDIGWLSTLTQQLADPTYEWPLDSQPG
ncbi:PadR family transcriptional regulator [Actinoplanes sp. NPDC020271]|uniref:PadR family transcriptional regulator n=1 Tax=Actinoplanes sp. NPDC020271 TaxID=3363896 RepID=UPI0037A068A3